MATISVSVDEPTLDRFTAVAARHDRDPQSLLERYVEYLIEGGSPVDDDIPVAGIMRLAEVGGSFDWLKDEPDLYSDDDGEPYE